MVFEEGAGEEDWAGDGIGCVLTSISLWINKFTLHSNEAKVDKDTVSGASNESTIINHALIEYAAHPDLYKQESQLASPCTIKSSSSSPATSMVSAPPIRTALPGQ